MECPYCHREMEHGELHSRGGVYYLPDGETMPKLYTEKEMKKHNAIIFPPYILGDKAFPKAYVCKNCNKLIINIEND